MAGAIAALLLFVVVLRAEAAEKPRIAIIIDDLGYALSLGRRVNELPGPISIAVLPATPRGKLLAEEANAAGKDDPRRRVGGAGRHFSRYESWRILANLCRRHAVSTSCDRG